jgi:hypothetical protein
LEWSLSLTPSLIDIKAAREERPRHFKMEWQAVSTALCRLSRQPLAGH